MPGVDASTVTGLAARCALVGSVVAVAGFLGVALEGSLLCAGTGCDPPSAWRPVFAVGLLLVLGSAALAVTGKLYARATTPP